MAVWPSWPQACILPETSVERIGLDPVISSIGSASMSARRPTVALASPLMTPTTPVRPTPVDHLVAAEF
jgi:hypothetical protein